ncbi:MAG TPA: hypothetical protein VG433_16695 [Pirellulales bacterium]|nr:hypothetical protein [Pirellulales bacterium]
MDFQKRLEKAVERGKRASSERARAHAEAALSEEELKRLHSQYRLELSEHIEKCLHEVAYQFPGFRFESVVGDRGWGAAISRDDLSLGGGKRLTFYSRLEMTVRPFSQLHVLDLTAKGAIRNKESFNRSHYHNLAKADITSFNELIDLWVLEYAEQYAASD